MGASWASGAVRRPGPDQAESDGSSGDDLELLSSPLRHEQPQAFSLGGPAHMAVMGDGDGQIRVHGGPSGREPMVER